MGEAEAEVGDAVITEELDKLTERKLKIRRRAVFLSTATVFTIAAILLFISFAQIHGYQVSPTPPLPSCHLISLLGAGL